MRILQVHNRYQGGRGGEDRVMDNESRLLRTNGNEVHQFTAHNNEIGRGFSKLRAAIRMPYSKAGARRVARAIATYRPDIVHVHNFHYVLTPAIFDACREARVPSVQTLHNFRGICANATFMRDGRVCEECMHGSPYRGVLHRCYEDSALKTLPIARTVAYHRKRQTWHDKVDRFIALTEFGKGKYVEGGYSEKRISVKPNFSYPPDPEWRAALDEEGAGGERSGALFVGHLLPWKGIALLMEAWRNIPTPLRVAGSGPLLNLVTEAEKHGVSHLGLLDAEAVYREMRRASFLVFSSVWYECFPLTFIEAFAAGLPIVAAKLGAAEDIISHGETGLHFTPGDPRALAEAVAWAAAHPEDMARMGENARRQYEALYTPDANYARLTAIYEQTIAEFR
ncbi:MAG: glycosyltransferase [Alphaproteobacteria bacterium]|nr:glycosyltransferase [Rhodospirillales bacterium]MDP6591404.1 glycosyltransferase [Alphaproteobacteria bacterium]MDP6817125.1 glycosyltransferase [Alphaproteobacteria bacterium]